ncbi:response regulator transcription factor [Nonomuraea sp. LPB2021202275-12-8]|uniref:response regulator transcription factor n=1 Tax=Nonomuraea sp. LPB2021202275-12-8 TaxID=3120159 RepID=UPI00300D90C6
MRVPDPLKVVADAGLGVAFAATVAFQAYRIADSWGVRRRRGDRAGPLRRGAAGFVLKDAGPVLLVEAVRAAYAGDALISPSIARRLLRRLADSGTRSRARAPAQPLTAREIEVVRAVARGRTNQEIAGELFISLSTVKGHVSGVQAKLGVRNRVGIAAWAWESRMMGDPRR